MPPPRRANSLVRGSGHSLQGTRPGRDSMVKGKKGTTTGQNAVYDMILLENVSEDSVMANLATLFNDEIIYVCAPKQKENCCCCRCCFCRC
jgi:myosin-1